MGSGEYSLMNPSRFSPIVLAIAEAEKGTTGEIRVHLSRKWREPDAFGRATHLFQRFDMARTAQRNAVLLYVNLRKHKFAVVGDTGIHGVVGQGYWDEIARELIANLRATHPEKAIAIAVQRIGETLHKYFPAEHGAANPDELSNEVTED